MESHIEKLTEDKSKLETDAQNLRVEVSPYSIFHSH